MRRSSGVVDQAVQYGVGKGGVGDGVMSTGSWPVTGWSVGMAIVESFPQIGT
jgi:hypothetical protein